MQINVFSGARRVAVVLAALIVTAAVLHAGMTETMVRARFVITSVNPFLPPEPTSGDCSGLIERSVGSFVTPRGYRATIAICASESLVDESPGIIYDAGEWGEALFDSVVVQRVEADGRKIARYRWTRNLLMATAAILVLGVATMAIGWVVRGFLGIPRGMDRRPENSAPTE